MTTEDLSKILKALESGQPKGLGVFALAKQTGLSRQDLRDYLVKHKDYFIALPEQHTYVINRFGKFKGSISEILENHSKDERTQKAGNTMYYVMLLGGALVSLMVAIWQS